MSRAQYYSNSYSEKIKELVRLLIKIKICTSKILKQTILIVEGKETQSKSKFSELETRLKILTFNIQESVTKIIALNQPLAFDLRFLLSAIQISLEFNSIANWTKKTINATERLKGKFYDQKTKDDLVTMLNISYETLTDAISTLLQFDAKKKADKEILKKIQEMLARDDKVDDIYRKILQYGLNSMKDKSSDAVEMFEVIGIAKNLEKVSDCIHDIIVTTRYVLTGERI